MMEVESAHGETRSVRVTFSADLTLLHVDIRARRGADEDWPEPRVSVYLGPAGITASELPKLDQAIARALAEWSGGPSILVKPTLSSLRPQLLGLFQKYLLAEPEGDWETFCDWVMDEKP